MRPLRRPLLILSLLFVGALFFSLFVGRYPAPYWMPVSVLRTDPLAQRLVINLRLPRVLTACLLGMSLATAGTVLQMIFRNPLVEPGFLGVSPGAAFGAAFSILFLDGGPFLVEVTAAIFAGLGLVGEFWDPRADSFN